MSDLSERVRVHSTEVLSDDWYLLKKTTLKFLRNDGTWQRQSRSAPCEHCLLMTDVWQLTTASQMPSPMET
jgi:hypothetical protein